MYCAAKQKLFIKNIFNLIFSSLRPSQVGTRHHCAYPCQVHFRSFLALISVQSCSTCSRPDATCTRASSGQPKSTQRRCSRCNSTVSGWAPTASWSSSRTQAADSAPARSRLGAVVAAEEEAETPTIPAAAAQESARITTRSTPRTPIRATRKNRREDPLRRNPKTDNKPWESKLIYAIEDEF